MLRKLWLQKTYPSVKKSLKKNNYSSNPFSYSNIINKQRVSNPSHQVPVTSTYFFPPLTFQSHYHYTPHRHYYNNHSSYSKQTNSYVLSLNNFSLPDGNFLDSASKIRPQDPKRAHADLTWVNTFCIKLSESLSNCPSLSHLSSSSFQNLIKSSLSPCLIQWNVRSLPEKLPSIQHLIF